MIPLARLLAIIALIAAGACVLPDGNKAQAAESDTYCLTGTSTTGAPIFLPASPTTPCPVAALTKNGAYTPLGCTAWQTVTNGSAVALSAVVGGIPAGSTLVDLVPTVAIVFRDDGSAPTSTGPGIPIQTDTIYPYSGTLAAVQFIATSTSGSVAACFYK